MCNIQLAKFVSCFYYEEKTQYGKDNTCLTWNKFSGQS